MSSLNYNIQAGFKAVSQWQEVLVRNAQGLLQPGYNQRRPHFGATSSGNLTAGQGPTGNAGGRGAMGGAYDSLRMSTELAFEQGEIRPDDRPTSLAIKGPGFFVVAENLNPGARLFVTRSGDFRYDAQGRLVNSRGLYVVGGHGTITDPPTPVTDPGDGSVLLPSVTLARIPVPGNLRSSLYGDLVYEVPPAAGSIQAFPNGRREVGFVQPSSLEFMSAIGMKGEIQAETVQAQQTYKMFKDLLESYNRMVDDAIQTAGR